MSRPFPAFGWALCFLPLACASSEVPGWSGSPSPSGAASTANTASAGGSNGTPASGAGAVTGLSSGGSSGGTSPSSGSGGGSSTSSSSGSSGSGSSGGSGSGSPGGSSGGGGVPLGGGDGGPTTQSKTIPDVFADAGAYSPPAEAGSGEHHPGQSCMQSGCHGSGNIESFLIAGTVFKDYAGTIPYPGVEVRVQDANGRTYTTYSRSNGNFYMGGGGGSLALPAIVAARDATTTRPMVTQLTTAGMGSCASAGCHVVGGSPSTGAYYPIHVP